MPQRKCVVSSTVWAAQTHARDLCGWVDVGREGIHTVASGTRLHIHGDEWKPIHAFAFVVFHFIFFIQYHFDTLTNTTCAERHAVIVIMNQQTTAGVCVRARYTAYWVCGYASEHANDFVYWLSLCFVISGLSLHTFRLSTSSASLIVSDYVPMCVGMNMKNNTNDSFV